MFKSRFAKIFTAFLVLALAGVAVFTAVRLYQLKSKSVTPTAPDKPLAYFECAEYNLLVDVDGTVRISNPTDEAMPSQNIDLIVDGETIGNFDIPALNPDEVAILGDLNLPPGDYNWSINGIPGCTDGSGNTLESCQELVFNPQSGGSVQPTATPTSTATPTPTATPTSQAVGGGPTSTPTNRPTPTSTATPTPKTTNSPTPTGAQQAQASPTTIEQLPDSGLSYPTIILLIGGVIILSFSAALVLL